MCVCVCAQLFLNINIKLPHGDEKLHIFHVNNQQSMHRYVSDFSQKITFEISKLDGQVFIMSMKKHLKRFSAIYELLQALWMLYERKKSNTYQCTMKFYKVPRSPSMKLSVWKLSSLEFLSCCASLIDCTLNFTLATRYCY